jgi:membrane-bound serine protease (ClpP class)
VRARLLLAALALSVGAAFLASTAPAQTPPAASTASAGIAYSIQLQADIDPATQRWVSSALDDAASENATIAIIRLDTPGGLIDSLRAIVQDIEAAPMPVVVYVSPNGARAASAGAYITEAADVAAMAPETNIGSATPISISATGSESDLERKIVNDSAASMRALASVHGRNPKLAQSLVTSATNVTAAEAKHAGLIDLVAPTQDALLTQLNGFTVRGPKAQVLDTTGLTIEQHDMPLTYQLLDIIVNPNVSYLLLLVGIIGIAIELFSPGLIFPGALGAISLVLGFYANAQLPVTPAGVILFILGFVLIVAEVHLPTHGLLGVAGVASLTVSGLLLYNTSGSPVGTSPVVVVAAAGILGSGMLFVVRRAVAARHLPKRTGWEGLVGAEAEVRQPLDPIGQVFVAGALWRAAAGAPDGDGRWLRPGSRVRVESVHGLTLNVTPGEPESDGELAAQDDNERRRV